MSKIAHLILAHHDPTQLERLVKRLAHPDADVYIHLDGKADAAKFAGLLKIPNVYLIKKRVKVFWGSYTIVEATVNSFAEILATKKNYGHINLLSGNDYPIKSIAHIHEFFDQHPGNIFMEYETEGSDWWRSIKTRVTNYHFTDFHFSGSYVLSVIVSKLLPARKPPVALELVGRSQWLTLTPESAQYVLDYLQHNPKVVRFFKFCWGSDEVAIQSILYNSPFKDKIVNNNYRYIDWSQQRASPKTLTMADADKLISSPCLFARKLDLNTEPALFDHLDQAF